MRNSKIVTKHILWGYKKEIPQQQKTFLLAWQRPLKVGILIIRTWSFVLAIEAFHPFFPAKPRQNMSFHAQKSDAQQPFIFLVPNIEQRIRVPKIQQKKEEKEKKSSTCHVFFSRLNMMKECHSIASPAASFRGP